MSNDKLRIRDNDTVLVISEEGNSLGEKTYREAKTYAVERNLDVIVLSNKNGKITVKIGDMGKYLYEQKKRQKEQQKKQKQSVQELKELWVRPGIGENDLITKEKAARKFIKENNKVKITLKFRGREITHSRETMQMLYDFADHLADCSKIEGKPLWNNKLVSITLIPLKE